MYAARLVCRRAESNMARGTVSQCRHRRHWGAAHVGFASIRGKPRSHGFAVFGGRRCRDVLYIRKRVWQKAVYAEIVGTHGSCNAVQIWHRYGGEARMRFKTIAGGGATA